MTSTRDPDTMTADERRLEVASILANGLLRRIRQAKAVTPGAGQASRSGPGIGLDLPSKKRLSVAQRPAG